MTQYWQFTPVDRIEESTFHPVLERFYKAVLDKNVEY